MEHMLLRMHHCGLKITKRKVACVVKHQSSILIVNFTDGHADCFMYTVNSGFKPGGAVPIIKKLLWNHYGTNIQICLYGRFVDN